MIGITGLVRAVHLSHSEDYNLAMLTAYLLQLYMGYLLCLVLAFLFALDVYIFDRFKIDYRNVMQLDPQTCLHWRQFLVLPSAFFGLWGLSMFLNFHKVGNERAYKYWFAGLVAVTCAILLAPVPSLQHHTRKWMLKSMGRLLLTPIVAPAFHDIFIGDMMCSEVLAVRNVALFFALYTQKGGGTSPLDVSLQRLTAFFATWPAVLSESIAVRAAVITDVFKGALQCLRCWWDSKKTWMHFLNASKYALGVCQGVMLSVSRIDQSRPAYLAFVVLSSISTV